MTSTASPPAGEGDIGRGDGAPAAPIPRLGTADVREALRLGFDDFRNTRTDTLLIPVIYPVAGLIMAGVLVDQDVWPFVFPVLSGFALLGPLATLLFAALSRKRERGGEESLGQMFDTPRLRTIQRLGGIAVFLFLVWNGLAAVIYSLTMGRAGGPGGIGFVSRVFTTAAGWEMIVIGCAVGAVFAVATLAIGCVSFPMALDRDVSTRAAIGASARAMLRNPGFAAGWGAIIVAGLVLGALPGLLGLIVVLPVLGHATWHIYRRMIPPV